MNDAQDWEDRYIKTKVGDLPWNAGGPDPDLVRLVKSGRIPVGQALDVGSGPGHDAVFLIQEGFNVIAVDISPTAVILARENASHHGLFGFFQQGDIRRIPVEDGFIDFANDRGCFHVLSAEDRAIAVKELHRVLRRGGLLLLRVFSDKEPTSAEATAGSPAEASAKAGPQRFTRKELEDLFQGKFKILEFWEGVFEGPMKPKSYSLVMEKR
jgi:SAM-dependent methyltransferase